MTRTRNHRHMVRMESGNVRWCPLPYLLINARIHPHRTSF